MTELTPQQKLSLATDKNIAVTAGAGTGKTRILVERYLHILLTESVDIKEVLAITFTDKAASEMMERVSKQIDELLNSQNINKPKLFQLKNRLSSSYISTIHSFCLRLLKENPIEAQLDPDFKVLNDFQNSLLRKEAITEILEVINQDKNDWIEFFRIFGLNNIINMLEFGLSHRFELHNYINKIENISSDELFRKLVEHYLNTVNNVFDDSLLNSIDLIIKSIPISDFATAGDNKKGSVVVNALESYLKINTDRKSIEYWKWLFKLAGIFTAGSGNQYKNLAQLGSKKSWSDSTARLLVELSETINPINCWQSANPSAPPGKLDYLVFSQMPQFFKLFNLVSEHYSQKKSDLTAVDFEDLQLKVWDLLQNNPEVCSKISKQFKYVMVDEFQDTNLLQWQIIAKLGEIKENKFFIVGDPKQSIYGFRNADVRVFKDVKNQFEINKPGNSESGNITLSHSFRFKENINIFINDAFNSILTESENNPWEVDYEDVSTARDDKAGGQIDLAFFEQNDSTDLQSEFVARRIIQLVNQQTYRHGDIAILLRTRNHLPEIEEKLRNYDVPFKTIGGIGFYQRQEIYDVYNLIQFLVDPDNDLALIGILRSPFANISDEGLFFLAINRNQASYWDKLSDIENIDNLPGNDLKRLKLFRQRASCWIKKRDRIDFSELLNEIIHECFYQVSMIVDFNGEQLFANLKKISRIAEEYEKTGFTSLIDFAESLKQLINSTSREGEAQTDLEDETTVKVMTVHQAKGLEFSVVFFPYLEQQLKFFSNNCYFDSKWGLVSNINSPTRKDDSIYLLDLLKHKQQLKELAELKRLFYVACSRVRNHLVLTATVKENQSHPDTLVEWLLNSLDLTTGEILAGNIREDLKKNLQIWLDLPEIEIAEKGARSKAQSSINILKKSKSSSVDNSKSPFYLEEITDQPKKEIFSATQLMTFIEDKKSYFNRYHLGFFEEDYERLITSGVDQDLAIIKGKIIHKYLEYYPNSDLESLLFEFEILNPAFKQELKDDLLVFENRLKDSKFLSSVLNNKEFKNELSITRKLGDSFLTGAIDRMFKNENRLWEVVDYKTNKIKSNQIDITAEKYKTQIEVYALLLSSIFPQQKNYNVTLYFIQPDDFFKKVFTKDELIKVENKLLQTIQEVKQYYPYTDKRLTTFK